MGTSQVPIDVAVSATDGKYFNFSVGHTCNYYVGGGKRQD